MIAQFGEQPWLAQRFARAGSGGEGRLLAGRDIVDRSERPARPPVGQAGVEQVADVVHEQRARAGRAFVVRHMPAEDQQLLGARNGRIQQISLGREHILELAQQQPRDLGKPPPLLLGEERLWQGAPGKGGLLEAAHEERRHPSRSQGKRVEHRDGPR